VETIVIPSRFRGPVDSGNGGYTCGVVAAAAGGEVEVTLRRPPPLDRPLTVERDGRGIRVLDGDLLVAEAVPAEWSLEVPDPPAWGEAEAASARYGGFERHAFPECFVCGTGRPDGLRIFAGPVAGRDLVAAPWIPDDSLPTQPDGALAPEMIWSALDCPGAWAVERHMEDQPVVLGRMVAAVTGSIRAGDRAIAAGWELGREGRKLFSGTALFAVDGTQLGRARQTWIVLAG
jgi:hypothetical protein